MSDLRIIISGGGTGGHIFPAIAIASSFKKSHPDSEILFVGARGKMEMEKVPEAGFNIVGLPIRGIRRKLDLSNLLVPFLLIRSIAISYSLIRKFRPGVVIGVGGYASAAVVLTASFLGIRTLVQEQNSHAGITNRLLGRKADAICVAFGGMEKFFPKEKLRLLGNPIRREIISPGISREESAKHFGISPSKFTILITGGSLGASTLNACAANLIPLLDELDLQMLWQCGNANYEHYQTKLEAQPNDRIILMRFIPRMDLAYSASDLIISRAGAITVSEITALRKPSILIPSPNVAEDHQTANASVLAARGAAISIPDGRAAAAIVQTVASLVENETKIGEMKSRLSEVFGSTTAADDIVKEIEKLIRPS